MIPDESYPQGLIYFSSSSSLPNNGLDSRLPSVAHLSYERGSLFGLQSQY